MHYINSPGTAAQLLKRHQTGKDQSDVLILN